MKRFLLVIVAFFLIGTVVYAQQSASAQPTSAETRQSAQQLLTQGQSNESQYQTLLAELRASNISNSDAAYFNQLRAEIERLESTIGSEEIRIKATLERGLRVSPEMFSRVERLMSQHSAKLEELQAFISR